MESTRGYFFALGLVFIGTAAEAGGRLVNIRKEVPDILLDIRYATENNFTHKQVYPIALCVLQESVAQKLKLVEQDLRKQGLRLKMFDCYRPLSAQKKFWALVPDERYVANPAKGSRHNRGFAVDLTLADDKGVELTMPSPYDDFSERAHRDFKAPAEAAKNRATLEKAMSGRGFVGLKTEWWHFDDPSGKSAAVLDVPLEKFR